MVDDGQPDQIPREQVETALRFLEWSHGDALRRPWSDEAHAYYEAIDILEAALDEELRPPSELLRLESEQELVERSREAREEGYAAATLLNERGVVRTVSEDRDREGGVVAAVRRLFT